MTGSVTIRIASPDSPASDISSGFAPLSVLLSAEATGIGESTEILSVFWDLGDGNTATSLIAAHTYQLPGRFPVSVTVVTTASGEPLRATRFIDVLVDPTQTPTPSPSPTAEPDDDTDRRGCGTGSLLAFWALAMMALLRKIIR